MSNDHYTCDGCGHKGKTGSIFAYYYECSVCRWVGPTRPDREIVNAIVLVTLGHARYEERLHRQAEEIAYARYVPVGARHVPVVR